MFFSIAKEYFSCFVIIVFFTFGFVGNVYALKDTASDNQQYTVIDVDGGKEFFTKMPNLQYLPTFIDDDGDMTIELLNPFCFAYIAAFVIAMYAGNLIVQITAVLALVAIVSIIYGIAYYKHKDWEMCGADWWVWGTDDEDGDLKDIKRHYPKLGPWRGSRAWTANTCVKDTKWCIETGRLDTKFLAGRDYLSKADKYYREYMYEGEELMPDSNCLDPREEARTYDVNNGVSTIYQRYYYRGTDTPNYACDRFLVDKIPDSFWTSNNIGKGDIYNSKHPYGCCLEASKKVCINDPNGSLSLTQKNNVHLCSTSSKFCTYQDIIMEINKGEGDDSKYCLSTWSLCPYNFNIQSGTEKILDFDLTKNAKFDSSGNLQIADECYDSDKEEFLSCKGKPKNFYQVDRHCTYLKPWQDSEEEIDIYSPYFDKACINMVGSSHNTDGYYNYAGYGKAGKTYASAFSAPLVECLTETIKNFLFNRAGHTRCKDTTKLPDEHEVCASGNYFTRNEDFYETKLFDSPTQRLMRYIRHLVIIAMTIMIMLYGWSVLLAAGKIETKDMYVMLVKLAVVVSFSYDVWWSKQLFVFVYSAMDAFTSFTAKMSLDTTVSIGGDLVKDDGCYFGDLYGYMSDDPTKSAFIGKMTANNFNAYPSDRRYVAFFDTLDCKVQKYLGVSMLGSGSKIAQTVAMAFIWPFNIGLIILAGSLIFMFFMINFTIKTTYMFITQVLGAALLLYISPFIIPCLLFKKTKGMFDTWLEKLIEFILNPFILFAYVSMCVAIIDQYTLGDAIYVGTGRSKQLMCGYACVLTTSSDILNIDGGFDKSKMIVEYIANRGNKNRISDMANSCRQYVGGTTEFVDMKRSSVLCFMENLTSGGIAFLNAIGIFIPALTDLTMTDCISFMRVALLLLIMNAALGTVPSVIKAIIGSAGLQETGLKSDPFALAKKAFDYAKTAKSFGTQAAKKILKKRPEDIEDPPEDEERPEPPVDDHGTEGNGGGGLTESGGGGGGGGGLTESGGGGGGGGGLTES